MQSNSDRYRLFFEQINEVAAVDELVRDDAGQPVDWVYVDVNAAFEQAVGLDKGRIVGRRASEVLGGQDVIAPYLAVAARVVDTGVPSRLEVHIAPLGGDLIISMIPFGDGRFATVSMNITDRKRAEEYLRRYRTLFEHARDIILFVAPDGGILEANAAAVATYGYSHDELLAMNIRDLRSGEMIPDVQQQMQLANGDGGFLFETVHRRRDGSTFPVEVSSQGAEVDGRRVLLSIVRDVSQRKAAEARADAEHRRLRTVLDALPAGVFIADGTGRVAAVNEEARNIWGHNLVPLESVDDYFDYKGWWAETGERLKAEDWALARALRQGETLFGDLVNIETFDGKRKTVLNSAAPIRDESGRIAGAVAAVQDVTELVMLRRALEDALEREKQSSQLLQRALLPAAPPDLSGYRAAIRYVPAQATAEIGGDFYDVFRLPDDRIGVLIGDVSGKGLEAASLAATTRSTIHAYAHETRDAGDILTRANAAIAGDQPEFGSFVTVFLAIVNCETGELSFCAGGHPPALISRAAGRTDQIECRTLPLALMEGEVYVACLDRLEPGDKLVMYTDGISEARHDHEMFGVEGVTRAVEQCSGLSAEQVADEILTAAGEWAVDRLTDDAAIVVFERSTD